MATDQPPPDEPEYREQVLERFTARARSLTQQFTILMIFAFGFLVFIIVPLAELNFDAAHVDEQKAQIKTLTELTAKLEEERTAQQQEVDFLHGNITSLNFVLEEKRRKAEARAAGRTGLQRDLKDNGAQRQQRQDQARSLESAIAGIERGLASFDADQRVADLRDWFFNTDFWSDRDPECQDIAEDNAEDESERIYLRCMVRKKLESDWQQDFALLRQDVVDPLRDIAPDVAGAVEDEVSAVKRRFRERLAENQDFWQSIQAKADFMDRLFDDFNLSFENIRAIVNQRLDKIAQQLAELEAEIAELERAGQELEAELAALEQELDQIAAETEAKFQELAGKEKTIADIETARAEAAGQIVALEEQLSDLPSLEEINQERADIEMRLSSFESPFGAIPIGLQEAVLAYPLILAAGFMVCALLLARLLHLRREFRNSLARDKDLSEANVSQRVATLAPLWFDPDRKIWANPALVIALFIPFALFSTTAWLIVNDWLLQLGDTTSAINLRRFYAGLYGLGLVVFAVSAVRVRRAWTRYQTGPAPASAASQP